MALGASLDRQYFENGNKQRIISLSLRKLKVCPFRRHSPFADYRSRFLYFCHFLRREYVECRLLSGYCRLQTA